MTCSKCGLHIPEGAEQCPNCHNPAPPKGFLRRILRGLGLGTPAPGRAVVKTRTTEIRTERIEVQDPHTGQVHVYRSLDEVPAELRDRIEAARRAAGQSEVRPKITVKDASGTTRTYESVDEMPEEIRKIYERVQQERMK